MPTVSQTPINIIAGQSTPALPAGQSVAYGSVACVIYNATSSILQVQAAGGSRFLQPTQADVYPVNNAAPVPTVTPITLQAVGTILGTITSTFYDTNDGVPPGFPQPLVPFPGGTTLVASPIVPVPGFFSEALIAPPPNTQSLTVTNPSGVVSGTLTVVGVQSRTTYFQGTVPANGSATFSVVNPITTDTAFNFMLPAMSPLIGSLVYASPTGGLILPTFATSAPTKAITTGTLLAAPTTGANYLFGIDLDTLAVAGTQILVEIESPAGTPIGAVGVSGAADAAGPDITDHVNLNGFRTTSLVKANYLSGAGSGGVMLRYAPGP